MEKRNKAWSFLLAFLQNGLIVFASYALFFQQKYTTDTYWHAEEAAISRVHLQMGRVVAGAIAWVCEGFGLRDWSNQAFYCLFVLLCVALCATLLSRRALACLENPGPWDALCLRVLFLLAFINVFYMSMLMFTEASIIFGCGLMLCVFAALLATRGRKLDWLWAGLLLGLGLSCYEAYTGEFVVLCCLLLCARERLRFTRDTFLSLCKCALAAVVGVALYAGMVKITTLLYPAAYEGRMTAFSLDILLSNLNAVKTQQFALWYDGFLLMEPWSLPVYAGLLLLLCAVGYAVYRKRFSFPQLLLWGLAACVCYGAVFATHYVKTEFFFVTRTLFPLFAFLGLLALFALLLLRGDWGKGLLCCVMCAFFVLSLYCVQDTASDQLITNRFEKQYALAVGARLTAYEKETGVEVEKISCRADTDPTAVYTPYVNRYCLHTRDVNVSSMVMDWSNIAMLNFYTGRHLTDAPLDEELYARYFPRRDWTEMNLDEQLIIVGDTAYLSVY